ncbi:5'-3' exoribonuclease 2 [Nowakowskiella sp. JEL0407]|nr:5'-3' exoribonuclease 2 [Nowakowskiella sp. JEL0407]
MADDFGDVPGGPGDNMTEFATFEDYLDSQITSLDLFYLEDKELARQLVELGYRGSGEPLKREEFESRKKAAENFRLSKRLATKVLASHGKDLSKSPFLQALAEREEANRNGKLTVIEEKESEVNGTVIPVDITLPNPNSVEFDNLYLDMNGIIHPCCHPEDGPAPSSEEEMFAAIFKYIDRIMAIVRPRKVLFMAIDGVAPRAKMNQQRSRRFRAALDEQLKYEEEQRAYESNPNMPRMEKKQRFDSNCITPGTPFMAALADALRYYIADRVTNNAGWRDLKIIFSDANVPGEGEHKIMDFIRRQRAQPYHNPNTRHVLYGLDADLIMLALATHEPHFKILREDVFFNMGKDKPCFICGQTGHIAAECTGKAKEKQGEFDEKGVAVTKPYIFLHIDILREYLSVELTVNNIPFEWNLERAIDDWVFMCFFVGNDFIPHIPSMEIREGAINRIVEFWKRKLPDFGGYVTNNGEIDLFRARELLEAIGQIEDAIFIKRRNDEERRRLNQQRKKDEEARIRERHAARPNPTELAQMMAMVPSYSVKQTKEERYQTNRDFLDSAKNDTPGSINPGANAAAAAALRASLGLGVESESEIDSKKRKIDEVEEAIPEKVETVAEETKMDEGLAFDEDAVDEDVVDEDVIEEESGFVDGLMDEEIVETMTVAEPAAKEIVRSLVNTAEIVDEVRFWETGWKTRYYETKFNVSDQDFDFRRKLVTSYLEGLCWVLKYYYQGVQSWKWYYPYHYSPFASDFTMDIVNSVTIKFELGTPFRPIDQLMGVFPSSSKQHIPEVFHGLMTSPESPIIDFYPQTFPIDLNGKKYAWQGVALLPFIEEQRLLEAMEPYYEKLSDDEKKRNSLGPELIFMRSTNAMYEQVSIIYEKRDPSEPLFIDPKLSGGMCGMLFPDPEVCIPGCTYHSPFSADLGFDDVSDNQSLSVIYKMPSIPPNFRYATSLLPRVELPPLQLSAEEVYWVQMGGRGRGRGRGGNFRGGAGDRMIRHGIGMRFTSEYGGQNANDLNDGFPGGGFVPKRQRQQGFTSEYQGYDTQQRMEYSSYSRPRRDEDRLSRPYDQYGNNNSGEYNGSRYDNGRNGNYNGQNERFYNNQQYGQPYRGHNNSYGQQRGRGQGQQSYQGNFDGSYGSQSSSNQYQVSGGAGYSPRNPPYNYQQMGNQEQQQFQPAPNLSTTMIALRRSSRLEMLEFQKSIDKRSSKSSLQNSKKRKKALPQSASLISAQLQNSPSRRTSPRLRDLSPHKQHFNNDKIVIELRIEKKEALDLRSVLAKDSSSSSYSCNVNNQKNYIIACDDTTTHINEDTPMTNTTLDESFQTVPPIPTPPIEQPLDLITSAPQKSAATSSYFSATAVSEVAETAPQSVLQLSSIAHIKKIVNFLVPLEEKHLQVSYEALTSMERELMGDHFDTVDFINCLPTQEYTDASDTLLPPWKDSSTPQKLTLILDLDETLVHCTTIPSQSVDLKFSVPYNNTEVHVTGRCRPGWKTFLSECAELFEVVVFTASQKMYADKVLDIMDPENKYISFRLFRHDCVEVDGNFLKDLSRLGRDLRRVVIIDNSVQAFGYQLENGIPITSWYEDPHDNELLHILDFLKTISEAEDVRPCLERTLGLVDLVKETGSVLKRLKDINENLMGISLEKILED